MPCKTTRCTADRLAPHTHCGLLVRGVHRRRPVATLPHIRQVQWCAGCYRTSGHFIKAAIGARLPAMDIAGAALRTIRRRRRMTSIGLAESPALSDGAGTARAGAKRPKTA